MSPLWSGTKDRSARSLSPPTTMTRWTAPYPPYDPRDPKGYGIRHTCDPETNNDYSFSYDTVSTSFGEPLLATDKRLITFRSSEDGL